MDPYAALQPTKDYRVTVMGPLTDANYALGLAGIHKPYRKVTFAEDWVLATVSAGLDQLEAWAARGRNVPGALLAYRDLILCEHCKQDICSSATCKATPESIRRLLAARAKRLAAEQ